MKILYICREDLPTYRPDVHTLIECGLSQHCQLTIVASVGELNENNPAVDYQSVSTNRVFTKLLGHKLTKVIGKFFISFNLVRKRNYDLVIVRDNAFLAALMLLVSKVYNFHSSFWLSILIGDLIISKPKARTNKFYGIYTKFYKLIETLAKNKSDLLIAQSEAMRISFINNIDIKGDVIAVPMGIDEVELSKFRVETKISEQTIGYLGAVDTGRNIELLLDVIMLLLEKDKFSNAKLKIVGGSENKTAEDELRREIVKRGLSKQVVLTGTLSRHDAWEEISKCEVCISYIPRSALYDVSSPTKLVEYLALGKKVVANDIPDQKTLLDGLKTGTICGSDINSISEAIELELEKKMEQGEVLRVREELLNLRGYSFLSSNLADNFKKFIEDNK